MAVSDFLTGKVMEPALDTIPPGKLKAFLNRLRDDVRGG